jgi:D-glycero-D-manno-heptose 1,7-bisphosphate phosphatase
MDRINTAFLDRDGVINRKPPEGSYVTSWEAFEFLPGAVDAIRLLNDSGVRAIVVSIQRGVAKGHMSLGDVEVIHAHVREELERRGAWLEAFLVCPHEDGTCDCRKPGIGLLRQAAARYPDIQPATSVLIGDSSSDIEAGNRFGCRTFLVGDETRASSLVAQGMKIDGHARSLLELVRAILEPGD